MGIILISSAILVTILVGLVIWATREPKRNPDSGCPIGVHAAPPAHTIILIDQTDSLNARELQFARALIRNEYYWLPLNGVLTIRTIVADVDDDKDQIMVCRVKTGAEGNGVTNNATALDKEFRRMVGDRLDAFLRVMASAPVQKNSPIAESVGEVYQRTDFGRDIKARRLVILSDMAQFSPLYSQYGQSPSRRFKVPAALENQYGGDMAGSVVRVQYVKRSKLSFQGSVHKSFWKKYFERHGASDVAIGHSLDLGEAQGREIWHEDAPQR